jgi:hypothetical protein
LSLTGTAETLIIANAGTKALFGMGAIPWVTEGWLTPKSSASVNSWNLSLSELVKGMIPGGESFGMSGNVSHGWTNDFGGVTRAVMRNLQQNGAQSVATAIVTPIAFKMAKKVFRRPISSANRLLKSSGVRI